METSTIFQMQAMKRERQNEQMTIYLFVLSMYLLSFLLGLLGYSMFWIFFIALITFTIWKRRVFALTERYIREKETILNRKKALRQSETSEWLNFVINRWLVFSSNTLSDVVKRKIDPILQHLQPYFLSSLELKRLNFDTKTPSIQSVLAFEVDEGNKRPVSWSNVVNPPFGLKLAQKHQVIIEARVELVADEFMELTAKLSGKWLGLSLDLAIEKLSVRAMVQMTVHFDKDAPFPHVSVVSLLLTEKPDVHFGVRVLRHVQLMEIPLLKMWIHNIFTNALCQAFVDPSKLEFTLDKTESLSYVSNHPPLKLVAVGVLTITVSGTYKAGDKKKSKQAVNALELLIDTRYCLVTLGNQQSSSPLVLASSPFTHSTSFLVYSLSDDKIEICLKSKVFLTSQSLTSIIFPLSNYPLDQKPDVEETIENILEKSNETLKLTVHLQYSPLPSWDAIIQGGVAPIPDSLKLTKTGVVNVCIHGASDLLGLDSDGLSDPYCIVYNNGKKLLCTHYIPHTRNPCWEVFNQFIVDDISKVVLSFVVYDWDGTGITDDDFLGSTHFFMSECHPKIIYQSFPLNASILTLSESSLSKGNIILSVVFIPIENILPLEPETSSTSPVSIHTPVGTSLFKADEKFPLLSSDGILDINIIQASNLIAKDRNGLSDPFCEVFVGRMKKFATNVKKKTLNPAWNEQCTLELPRDEESLEIVVWDHDLISRNDFIGSLTLSRKQLIHCSNDIQHDGWFKLEKVPMGLIQVKFRVFIQDVVDATGEDERRTLSNHLDNDKLISSDINFYSSPDETSSSIRQVTSDNPLTLVEGQLNRVIAKGDIISTQSLSPSRHNGEQTNSVSFKSLANESRLSKRFQRGLTKLTTFVNQKRQSVNPEFNESGPPYELHVGIKIEVTLIEGLPNLSTHSYCKVKLISVVDKNRKRTLAKSSQFIPTGRLIMNFNFEVDKNHGESKKSCLIFSIKSSAFTNLTEKNFTLEEILPNEKNKKKPSVLNLNGVLLHLNCSYERTQMGYNIHAQRNQKSPKIKTT